MKKYVYILLILSLLFISCEREDGCNCNKVAKNKITLIVNGKKTVFNQYDSDKTFNYITIAADKKEIKNVFKSEYNEIIHKTNENKSFIDSIENILGYFYFIDSDKYLISNNDSIDLNKVSAILVYTSNIENNIVATMYLNNNGNYIKSNIIDELKTNFIISSDIYNIAKNELNIQNATIVSYIDTTNGINNNEYNELQFAVKNTNGTCTGDCSGLGQGCLGEECLHTDDPVCPIPETKKQLNSSGLSDNDYIDLLTTLHDFRDTYLIKHKGGVQLTNLYYKLSKQIDYSNLSINNIVAFKNILLQIKPIVKNLTNNPYSNNILIDNSLKVSIVQFLENTKNLFNDTSSIDNIIDLVNLLSNKTNNEITNIIDSKLTNI